MSASIQPRGSAAAVRAPRAPAVARTGDPRRVRASLATIETYLLDRRRELRRPPSAGLGAGAAVEQTMG